MLRLIFYFKIILGIVLFSIGSVAQQSASTTIFGPKIYFHSSSTRQETWARTESQLQQNYRLIVKNADGGLHSQRNCNGLGLIAKLLCQVENAAQQLYVNTLRASAVSISLNGQPILTPSAFNRNTAQVELPLSVELNNQLQIKVTGSVISYVEVSIRAYGEELPLDQTPPILTHNSSGMQYVSTIPSLLNLSITTNEALQSFEVDGQIISSDSFIYTFQKNITAIEGNQIHVKAVDLAGNMTEVNYNLQVSLDDIAPVITLGSTPTYTNAGNVLLPVNIQDSSPTKTYILINQREISQTSETQFSYLIELPEDDNYQIVVRATDAAGNISEQSLDIVRSTAPLNLQVQAPASNTIYESSSLLVKFNTNHPLSSAFVNGVSVPIQTDGKSVEYLWTSPFDGPFTLEIKVVDIFSNEITQNVSSTIQLGGSALWSYTECPVE
ncbi:hypothetical protein [Pseudobdellovibrio exovorus]|uniref:Fibronectin type-III domain-containing protein n=1 Tax=Pseudobdellovibrio exovorus JSS TaxID=1184267 RepID=M4VE78_9BACT|nr:hypothetical protein [Pseudobdellovibrio exovorus]AGH96346.1 hypothetical protein A11Q_2130 [Pseudobdellovibrio exovorus JSS]